MKLRRPQLIREAVLDGIFYPQSATGLREAVRTLLLRTEELAGNATGIVSPHGSLQYSGLHQSSAFKSAAATSPQLVGVIAAATHDSNRTPAVPESDVFRTPMGDTFVARERADELVHSVSFVQRDDIPHFEAPSVETVLPFVQFLFPASEILPVLTPNLTAAKISELASALVQCTADLPPSQVLWVCSSNITKGGSAGSARRRADSLIEHLAERSTKEALPRKRAGRGYPAATCLALFDAVMPESCSFEILTRGSSCDFDGNAGSSIEYASAACRNL